MPNGIPIIQGSQRNTYLAQGINNFLAGILQQAQQKQQQQKMQSDLGIILRAQGQLKLGQTPDYSGLQTPQMQQAVAGGVAGQMFPTKLEQAQTKYYRAGAEKSLMPERLTPYQEQSLALEERRVEQAEKKPDVPETRIVGSKMFQYNTATKKWESTGIEETDKDKLAIATELRKEFNADKAYTDYNIIQRSERGMQQAYETSIDPKTTSKVASDQALAVLFQKMLDPASVVRESEYARTPEGISLINRIEAWLPQLQKGGLAVTDEDRKAIYDMAKKLLNEAKISLNRHIERYTTIAGDYGIEAKLIMGNIKKFDIGTTTPSSQIADIPEDISKMSDEELKKIAGVK